MSHGLDGRFPTTHWSVVLAAGDRSTTKSRECLGDLCRAYWYPVYVRIRRRERDAERSRDLTQAFFADVLERRVLESADPERGRFRCFLTTVLRNFLANERRQARALKRGGGMTELSLDLDSAESRYRREPFDDETPETLFDRAWARTMLSRALDRLRAEAPTKSARQRLHLLEPFLAGRSSGGGYHDIAAQLEITEDAVKTAVHRMRRRFGELLRAEVAQTLDDETLVDDEIRHLLSVLTS